MGEAFGLLLKEWRSRRRLSQLDLSMVSEVSQRHISFLESGRSHPSRAMVIRLASELDVPLRQQNELLTAAGYAPVYSAFDLDAPEVASIRRALMFSLEKQLPYPGLVMDRYWNQLLVNKGAAQLMGWLMQGLSPPPEISSNLMKLMLHPEGVRPRVQNWKSVVPHLLSRVKRESTILRENADSPSLYDEILTYPGLADVEMSPLPDRWHAPLLTVSFEKDGLVLNFFAMISTLGTPHDITLQELRIEGLFPADSETEIAYMKLVETLT